MTTRSKLAVVNQPKPPAKAERSYADFDDMERNIDALGDTWQRLEFSINDLDDAVSKCEGGTPSDKAIRGLEEVWRHGSVALSAKFVGGVPLDRLDADAAKARADAAYYDERPELWDDEAKGIIARKVVAEGVGLMIGSFPNFSPHAPEVCTAMLIEEIIAARPRPIIFEATCRRIRRTAKFPPTISEFLAAMAQVESEWAQRWSVLDGTPGVGDCIEDDIRRQREQLAEQLSETKPLLERLTKLLRASISRSPS